ncbi:MAG: prephenate dehydrogenase/arogenate dehydrogenase family protein, partial [Armatimonadota bacterium]
MEDSDPPFKALAVLGTGMIGAAIGLASRAAGCRVAGWDPDREAATTALARGALGGVSETLEDAIVGVDLVVVCAPPAYVDAVLADVLARVPEHVVVTDVTSVKEPIARRAERHPNLIPGHPMAGGER